MKDKMPTNKQKWMMLGIVATLVFISACMGSKKYIKNGYDYIYQKEWDKSVQYLKPGVKKYPDNVELKMMLFRSEWEASLHHLAKGETFLEESKFDEAINEFRQSLSYNTVNYKANTLLKKAERLKLSDIHFNKGKRFMNDGKYSAAKEHLEKSLEYNEKNSEALKLLSYFHATYKHQNGTKVPPKYKLNLRSDAPISLKFKKTPIVNVFEILSKLSGINFIFDKDMKETKVTLFMTDVSFDRFIDVLLKTNDLSARLVNDKTMLIYPDTPTKAKEYTDLQIRTFYLSNISSKKMVQLLVKILKVKDISENEKLNSIVIRGTSEVIELASNIIAANDREPAEVVLNVEILEVNRNKEHQLGLEFSNSVTMGIGETSTTIGGSSTDSEDNSSSAFASVASLYSLEGLSNKELLVTLPSATINLLKKDGDTKTLAKPQIRVKNMEKASIHVGDRVPIRSNRKVDSNNNETYDYEYQDVGIKLAVLPVINMNNEISLTLTLEVSGLGADVGTADDPQYTIRTRMAKTVLTMGDGEMIVIGGLINDEDIGSIKKIPVLGDLPVLGALFSNYGSKVTQKDVLMVITPSIIKNQPVFNDDALSIWSGKEKNFSLRPPYDVIDGDKEKYKSTPHGDYFDSKRNETSYKRQLKENKRAAQSPIPGSSLERFNKNKKNLKKESIFEQIGAASHVPGMTDTYVPVKNKPGREEKQSAATLWSDKTPFSIHVNSYTKRENAEERIKILSEMDYEPFIVPAEIPGKGTYYRVFIGRFETIENAKHKLDTYLNKKEFRKDIHIMVKRDALGG